jgi:hypothetical protein
MYEGEERLRREGGGRGRLTWWEGYLRTCCVAYRPEVDGARCVVYDDGIADCVDGCCEGEEGGDC